MPGLMRGMAKTAAVVGTATATRGAVNRRQANKNAQAYTQAMNTAAVQTPPPPQEAYAPAEFALSPQEDFLQQLERLCTLQVQGMLTDVEFTAAKQKLLAS
jgi:hypothetical protein